MTQDYSEWLKNLDSELFIELGSIGCLTKSILRTDIDTGDGFIELYVPKRKLIEKPGTLKQHQCLMNNVIYTEQEDIESLSSQVIWHIMLIMFKYKASRCISIKTI